MRDLYTYDEIIIKGKSHIHVRLSNSKDMDIDTFFTIREVMDTVKSYGHPKDSIFLSTDVLESYIKNLI